MANFIKRGSIYQAKDRLLIIRVRGRCWTMEKGDLIEVISATEGNEYTLLVRRLGDAGQAAQLQVANLEFGFEPYAQSPTRSDTESESASLATKS